MEFSRGVNFMPVGIIWTVFMFHVLLFRHIASTYIEHIQKEIKCGFEPEVRVKLQKAFYALKLFITWFILLIVSILLCVFIMQAGVAFSWPTMFKVGAMVFVALVFLVLTLMGFKIYAFLRAAI
eukprot:UN30334